MPFPPDPAALRRSYERGELLETDLAPDPHAQFTRWLSDAIAADLPEPNAMVLATADAGGAPSARTVLLKGVDERGFAFYTNAGSRKGHDLAENPRASLVFPWFPIERRCRRRRGRRRGPRGGRGYFGSRPYGSRIGAWASAQSSVIASREELEHTYDELVARFPPTRSGASRTWGGYRVYAGDRGVLAGRPSRLHDRLALPPIGRRQRAGSVDRLSP
jgi:pyridoxamine 5'-phosphate oxidase